MMPWDPREQRTVSGSLHRLTQWVVAASCAAVAITALAAGSAHGADPLTVGAARIDITPPVGFRKAGGYSEVISTGVHDPLYAKAIVLRQGDEAAALVLNDLCGVPDPLTRKAREIAAEQTGIPVDNIVVAATHTHGAPEYWGPLRNIFHDAAVARHGDDPHESIDLQSRYVKAWADAIIQADQNRKPSTAGVVISQQLGIAFNRRYHMRDGTVRFNPGRKNPDIVRPAGPTDPDLPFILFCEANDSARSIASFTTFAMHTTAFGGRAEFGGDFPGRLQTRLNDKFGAQHVSIFAEGTAGDINQINVQLDGEKDRIKLFNRIGNTFADTIESNLDRLAVLNEPSLAVANQIVRVPFDPVTRGRYEEARRTLLGEGGKRAPFLTLVEAWRDCHGYRYTQKYPDGKPLEVQGFRLDRDTAIVTLPHEVFVEIGMGIKAASPFRNTVVISLANDIDFYIPTRRAFEEGSYEVSTCPFHAGCGEELGATAIAVLNELKLK